MTAMQAALALALLALLAPGMPAATSARRLLDNGAHAPNRRMQSWMLVQARVAGQQHAAKRVLDSGAEGWLAQIMGEERWCL